MCHYGHTSTRTPRVFAASDVICCAMLSESSCHPDISEEPATFELEDATLELLEEADSRNGRKSITQSPRRTCPTAPEEADCPTSPAPIGTRCVGPCDDVHFCQESSTKTSQTTKQKWKHSRNNNKTKKFKRFKNITNFKKNNKKQKINYTQQNIRTEKLDNYL